MYIKKIILNIHSKKKFFEDFWLFLKLFLGADFEKICEYTFEKKKFFDVVWLFRIFFGVYILKIILNALLKFFFF